MYEHKKTRPLSRRRFRNRVAAHIVAALAVVFGALGIGIIGYHFVAGLPWVDATLDASMILGGMGPVSELHTSGAKLFASAYALFSGLVFIALVGLLLAPFAHRILHKLHWEDEGVTSSEGS
jgi:hypothetical protein